MLDLLDGLDFESFGSHLSIEGVIYFKCYIEECLHDVGPILSKVNRQKSLRRKVGMRTGKARLFTPKSQQPRGDTLPPHG
jgi:hypothetical protein